MKDRRFYSKPMAALAPQAIRIAEHRRAAQVVAVAEVRTCVLAADNAECATHAAISAYG